MAKKVIAQIKLQIVAGKGHPSPPAGPPPRARAAASALMRRAAGLEKGSKTPKKEKCGKISRDKVEEIAKLKMIDLDVKDLAAAIKTVEGTARSMGLDVV